MTLSFRRSLLRLLLVVASAPLAPAIVRADPIDDYNVASKFYKDQQWEHAEESFRRFLSLYPDHERAAAARLYQGQALVHLRKFEPAREAFRTFVAKHREHPDLYLAMYRIGECSYFLADLQAARVELDRFISAFPKHELAEWALQYLAETHLRLNDAQSATTTLQLQLDRFPQGRLADDARFLLAKAQAMQGDKDAALAGFQKLAASDTGPRAPDALVEAGMLLYDAERFDEARDAFAAVRTRFAQSPLLPVADLNAGYACYHLGEYDAAVKHFEHAAAVPAQAPEAKFWIGMSHKSQGDFAAAAAALNELAESTKDKALAQKARFHAADAILRGGDHAAAQALFLVVVDQDPQGALAADALHLATEAALLADNLDEADRLHERFARDYGDSGLWLLQRLLHGRIALARGDRAFDDGESADAQASYQQAADEFSNVAEESKVPRTSNLARLLLARVQDRQGDFEAVIQTLQPLLEALRQPGADGEFAEALVLAARANLKIEHNEEAAAASKLLTEQFSQHEQAPEALAILALASAALQQDQQVDAALDTLWQSSSDKLLAQRTTYQTADKAYAAHDWTRAAALFQKLIDRGSGEFQTAAYSGLGYSLHESKKYEEAAAAFEKLVDTRAASPQLTADAAHMRALSLRLAGKLDDAAAAYDSALRQFSKSPDAAPLSDEDQAVVAIAFQCAKGLARVRREQHRDDDADAAYAAALEQLQLLPADQQQELDKLIHEWALLHYNARRYERSDELFRKLVELRPDSELADDAKLYLGESHFFAGRMEDAQKAFAALADDAMADGFVRERSLVLLLDIAWDRKDWPAVLARAQDLAEKFPQGDNHAFANYRRGEALLQTGKAEEAIQALRPLHDTTDANTRAAEWFPGVRLLLAEAELQNKNYAAVEAIVQQFREEDPDSPLLYQADEILGRRFKNEARWDDARTALQRVVDSPNGRRTETAAKAQLLIAETYLLEMKDSQAVAEYYKVYLNYAFPEYQAPALFQAAQCDERLERWASAVKSYETLIEKFPDSEYARKAQPALEADRKRIPADGAEPPADAAN